MYSSVQVGADKIANIYVGANRVWTDPLAGGGGAGLGEITSTIYEEGALVTSHTVDTPAGVEVGDLLVLWTMARNPSDLTMAAPTGWTEEVTSPVDNTIQRVWTRVADGSEAASYTVNGENMAGASVMLRVAGGATVTATSTVSSDGTTGSTVTIPALAASTSGLVVYASLFRTNVPGTFAEATDTVLYNVGVTTASVSMATRVPTTELPGPFVVTYGGTLNSYSGVALALAAEEAATPGGGGGAAAAAARVWPSFPGVDDGGASQNKPWGMVLIADRATTITSVRLYLPATAATERRLRIASLANRVSGGADTTDVVPLITDIPLTNTAAEGGYDVTIDPIELAPGDELLLAVHHLPAADSRPAYYFENPEVGLTVATSAFNLLPVRELSDTTLDGASTTWTAGSGVNSFSWGFIDVGYTTSGDPAITGTGTQWLSDDLGVGLPAGWTAQLGSGAAVTYTVQEDERSPSGRSLRFQAASTNTDRLIAYTDLGDTFSEVVVRINPRSTTGIQGGPAVCLSTVGGQQGYALGAFGSSGGKLYKWVNGTRSEIGTDPVTYATNVVYYARLQADGTTVRTKVWDANDPEPAAWTLEVADTSHSSGAVGLYGWVSSTDYEAHSISAVDPITT